MFLRLWGRNLAAFWGVFWWKDKNFLVGGRGGSKNFKKSFIVSSNLVKKPTWISKKTSNLNGSFLVFLRLRCLVKGLVGEVLFDAVFPHVSRETSEAAASELVTWPWSSSSSWQKKLRTPKWGQIISNFQILNGVTQVLLFKFWLCTLFI